MTTFGQGSEKLKAAPFVSAGTRVMAARLRNTVVLWLVLACTVRAAGQPADAELIGDGRTDNTRALVQLLGSGVSTVTIPPGDYVTGKLAIPGKTTLILSPGVILRDSGRLSPNDRFITVDHDNVIVIGIGAEIVADRSVYTTGEQRHGMYVWGARHVEVIGLTASGFGGDGFYVGGPPGRPATDVSFVAVKADRNRRQGMSITSAQNLLVSSSEFSNTSGTSPQFGIDIEPNAADGLASNIRLDRVITRNNAGGGIAVELVKMTSTSAPVSVDINDHVSVDDGMSATIQSVSNGPGHVSYVRGISLRSKGIGIRVIDPFCGGGRLEIKDSYVIDNNGGDVSDPAVTSGIVLQTRGLKQSVRRFGCVAIDGMKVIRSSGGTRGQYGLWAQPMAGTASPWGDVDIKNTTVVGVVPRD